MEVNFNIKNCALAALRMRLEHSWEKGLASYMLCPEKNKKKPPKNQKKKNSDDFLNIQMISLVAEFLTLYMCV